jgi:hypothetical protein
MHVQHPKELEGRIPITPIARPPKQMTSTGDDPSSFARTPGVVAGHDGLVDKVPRLMAI